MNIREKLIELFYDNNVICDQKIEGLVDDVMDIIAHEVTLPQWISVFLVKWKWLVNNRFRPGAILLIF